MPLAREREIRVRHAVPLQRRSDRLGLRRRDDLVVETLEQQERLRDPVRVRHRRPLAIQPLLVGPRTDEVLVVARLELVRLVVEADEVGDAELGDPRREDIRDAHGKERGVPTCAAARDQDALGIDATRVRQVARRRSAIRDVDDTPLSAQEVAESTPVAGAAAVVDVDDGDPTRGEKLDLVVEHGLCVRGRSTVDVYDERRELALGRGEVRVRRWIEEPVRLASVTRVGDRFGHRDERRVDPLFGLPPDDLDVAASRVDHDDRRSLGRTCLDGDDPPPLLGDRPGRVARVRQVERLQLPGARVEELEALDRATGDDTGDAAIRKERVGRDSEDPLRRREFRVRLVQRSHPAVLLGVQVPPAVRIVDKVEHAFRAPLRLGGCLGLRARDVTLVRERPVGSEVGDPQLRALEREKRMVPGGPGEASSVGADARRRVEVTAATDHPRLGRAVGGKRDELVHRLSPEIVALAHTDDQPSIRGHASVGVAQRVRLGRFGRDRLRLRPGPVEAVHAPVVEARAPDRRTVAPGRPAAVLVDAASHVEARRHDVDGLAAVGTKHERGATRLVRAALDPVDPFVRGVDDTEPHQASADQGVDRDRRFPGAV